MSRLQQNHSDWFKAILEDIYIELPKWEIALLEVQKNIATEHEVLLENTYLPNQNQLSCSIYSLSTQSTQQSPISKH